ncbi:MAG: hypothetical protein F7B20_03220 [Aeropyrum sp.]|nr:hypothetical protein [Aeropyrum sp.]MCE4615647.1 hypothetical protein [Aeropyrum sp.]
MSKISTSKVPKTLGGFLMSISGIFFFAASVYMLYLGSVAPSLLAASIGLILVSLGSDLLKENSEE